MTPGRISGRSVASARSATAQAARDPLDLGRFLDRAVRLDPALDRDQLDVGRRGREPAPRSACDTKPASTPTRRAPTDAISSGQRSGRSPYTSTMRASGASRRAWIV